MIQPDATLQRDTGSSAYVLYEQLKPVEGGLGADGHRAGDVGNALGKETAGDVPRLKGREPDPLERLVHQPLQA